MCVCVRACVYMCMFLLAPGSTLPGIKSVVLGSFQKKGNSDGFRYACVYVCVYVCVRL